MGDGIEGKDLGDWLIADGVCRELSSLVTSEVCAFRNEDREKLCRFHHLRLPVCRKLIVLWLWWLRSGFGLKSCETEAAEGKRLETGLQGGVYLKAGAREKSSPGLKCLKNSLYTAFSIFLSN